MFLVAKEKIKGKINEKDIDGFPMGSKSKTFMICNSKIKNISIGSKKLAAPVATEKALKQYNKLIAYLTELLVSDDDTGDAMREALNQIERFRIQIKNKYRHYLMKKDLEMMSKQLVKLQKIANQKLLEIHNSYLEQLNNNRSK